MKNENSPSLTRLLWEGFKQMDLEDQIGAIIGWGFGLGCVGVGAYLGVTQEIIDRVNLQLGLIPDKVDALLVIDPPNGNDPYVVGKDENNEWGIWRSDVPLLYQEKGDGGISDWKQTPKTGQVFDLLNDVDVFPRFRRFAFNYTDDEMQAHMFAAEPQTLSNEDRRIVAEFELYKQQIANYGLHIAIPEGTESPATLKKIMEQFVVNPLATGIPSGFYEGEMVFEEGEPLARYGFFVGEGEEREWRSYAIFADVFSWQLSHVNDYRWSDKSYLNPDQFSNKGEFDDDSKCSQGEIWFPEKVIVDGAGRDILVRLIWEGSGAFNHYLPGVEGPAFGVPGGAYVVEYDHEGKPVRYMKNFIPPTCKE